MKHLKEVLCASVAFATASLYAIAYVEGRRGTTLESGGLPARMIPVLVSVVCVLSLAGFLAIALARRCSVGKASILLSAAILFFALGFTTAPSMAFRVGFRQRIKSAVSPDELRELARRCHAKLPIGGTLPGPGKWSLWSESEHRPQWNDLAGATSLGKLDRAMVILNETNAVYFTWGGALVGHWGLVIRTDGKPALGHIADGINTFITSE